MMNKHTTSQSQVRRVIVLAGLLSMGGGAALAQKPKAPGRPPAPAPEVQARRLPDAEAKRLHAEAGRDYEMQNHADALAKYLQIYPNYAGDFEVNQRLGWLYFNSPRGEFQKAIPYLRTAHKIDPGNVDVLHDLAKATAWGRLYKESVPLYREVLRVSPSVPDYWLEFARTLAWAGQRSEAVTYYNSYLGRSPTDMPTRLELARLLGEQKDFAGAMEQYNYVLRFQPGNVTARLGLAQILAWSGQLRPSIAEVDKILKVNPRNSDARTVKAFALLWLGELDQAKPLFQALAKQDPRNPEVQGALKEIARQEQAKAAPGAAGAQPLAPPTALQLAEQNEAQGRYSQAIAHYREHLAKSPQDEKARLRLARVLGWNKDFAEAESILRDWVGQHPQDPEGFLQLGRVLSWDQKYEEAAEQIRKGVALKAPDAAGHLELARILSWMKKYPEALAEYRTALNLQPENLEADLGIAQVLTWSGQLEDARKQVADLRRKHPQDPQATSLEQTLETLEAQRLAAKSISAPASEEYFRALVEKDPKNAGAHLELANLLLNRKEFPAAIKELRAAVALKPGDDALGLRLGKVLSWNREYAEAVLLYRQWLEKHPDDQEVRIDLARVLSWEKNYAASVAVYQDFLKRNPQRTEVRLELARVQSWAKQYDQAIQEFNAVLRQTPKNLEAWVGIGRVYSYQAKWSSSLEAFDRALAVKPDDRDARTGKAQTLLWSGETRRARGLLDELHTENPKDTTVLLSEASAENSLGRPDKALTLVNEAAALEPTNVEVSILRDQVQARLRPELRLGWSYVRDTEGLNIWRYQALDFRFNLHPRIRNFITVDFLPSSAPADVFGYAVYANPGTGPCSATQPAACVFFSPRVPVQPYVPSPGLLSVNDFPPELLGPANARIRQSAVQFQAGGTMQVNEWLTWTAAVGAVVLRHGSPDLTQSGFPSTRERFIYSASPAFRLNRRLEISLGFSRQYYAYTPKAISQTIHVDEQSATVTWTPDSRSRIALLAYHRGISPEFLVPTVVIVNPESGAVIGSFQGRTFRKHGNGGTLTATRTVWKGEKFQVEAGYDAMLFGYTHPDGLPAPEYYLNTGVFTPSFYQRHAGLLRTGWTLSKWLRWDLHGTAGGQQVRQGSSLSFSTTAGSRLDFNLSPRATLSLGYDYFNTASALQAFIVAGRAAAYHSNNLTATLHFSF